MATGRYDEAVAQYTRAVQLAPAFSFAAANRTLAMYAAGRTDEAMREMRRVHKCLIAPLWTQGWWCSLLGMPRPVHLVHSHHLFLGMQCNWRHSMLDLLII